MLRLPGIARAFRAWPSVPLGEASWPENLYLRRGPFSCQYHSHTDKHLPKVQLPNSYRQKLTSNRNLTEIGCPAKGTETWLLGK
jgi:hypothetical protein